MQPLVSVVIPMYNAAPFIGRCLRSVLRQDYPRIEVIMVDDCSQDDGLALAQHLYEEENPHQHKVYFLRHDRNGGVAKARLTALQKAQGEYLLFLDSDDYWDNNSVVRCWIEVALQENSPLVVSDHIIDYPRRKVYQRAQEIPTGRAYIQAILSGEQPGYLCNKLISHQVWKSWAGPIIEGQNLLEDYRALIPLFYHIDRVAYLHKPTLHYVQHNASSLTHRIKMEQKAGLEAILDYLSHYLLVEQGDRHWVPYIGMAYINIKSMLFDRIPVRDYPLVRAIHPEYDRYLWRHPKSNLNKLIYWLQSHSWSGWFGWLLLQCRERLKQIIR